MGNVNFAKLKAIEKENRKKLLAAFPQEDNRSGIYFLTRTDENGITYFYIGQSVHMFDRMLSHMTGYQHIDLSIRKRKFYSSENPYGWKVAYKHYPESQLDEMEQYWILEYTKRGFQCRYNKTAGGQGEGKEKINEYKAGKGYRDGITQGKKTLARDLKHIIDNHLEIKIKPEKQGNKVSQKQYEKFNEMLNEENYK